MRAVTTIGLDIAKSVFHTWHLADTTADAEHVHS
jgi:hypothetical protein